MDKAKAIFINARRYSLASKLLNKRGAIDPSFLLPSYVNAALSLELYFKALYWLEKNSDFKINGRHTHDFAKLYNSLSDDTRKELSSHFQNLMVSRDMRDVSQIEQGSQVTIPRDLEGNLNSWSQVFEDIRYVYEATGKKISMMFFPEIEECVLNVLIRLRPDFSNLS